MKRTTKPLRRHVFSDAYVGYTHNRKANETGEKLYQLYCDCQDMGLEFEDVIKKQGISVEVAYFLVRKVMKKREKKFKKALIH